MMKIAEFDYINHQGRFARRRVYPRRLGFTPHLPYYPNQYTLDAFDLDKNAMRSFAIPKIAGWMERDARHEEKDQYNAFLDAVDRADAQWPENQ